ncbi:MAG: PIN domain-containing protein [Oscillospiraceae bacterium]|nr:PIN domain-containing protein [Oscillospiraceae bacterium]
MKKVNVYLETTMFNYYFDTERDGHEATVRFFEAIGAGEYAGYTSDYVLLELKNAPEPKQTEMLALLEQYNVHVIDASDEIAGLADIYVRSGIIPLKYRMDGMHIATAAVHALDCVLSFNFQHINKLKTKRMTSLVHLNEGYREITICTPMEVLDNEEA